MAALFDEARDPENPARMFDGWGVALSKYASVRCTS